MKVVIIFEQAYELSYKVIKIASTWNQFIKTLTQTDFIISHGFKNNLKYPSLHQESVFL